MQTNDMRPLSARGAYGVVVRLVGLALILNGGWFLAFVVVELVSPAFNSVSVKSTFAIKGIAYVIGGAAMIYLAPFIVRLSYASARNEIDD